MLCLQSLLLCFLPVYCHFEWAAGAAVKIRHSINAGAPGGVGAMLLQPGEGAPTERWLLTELRLGSSATDGAKAKPENGAIWRRAENLDSDLAAVNQSKALGKWAFPWQKGVSLVAESPPCCVWGLCGAGQVKKLPGFVSKMEVSHYFFDGNLFQCCRNPLSSSEPQKPLAKGY